ncbi:ABC transporter permease subunit [Gluconobacter wancherniae]|nr:ABC transporter substrate-binding protein/permease [Gluconobacter wancherniae]MBS1087533.1 ABC transporter permease subunit [Gluconobacter wancherniae]
MRALFSLLMLLVFLAPQLHAEPVVVPGAKDATDLPWASDGEANVPYVFHDPAHESRITGFEKDLVDALAQKMHRKARFIQNDWDGLIPGLSRDLYAMVVDGIEMTPEHKAAVLFSRPYYVTSERIILRKDETGLDTLEALKNHKVGTLKDTTSERMLHRLGGVTISSYEEETNAFSDLRNGRLDAILLDAPIALYYGAISDDMKLVGEPIGSMEYGIAFSQNNRALRDQVDAALGELIKDGTLHHILARWNLWTPLMANYTGDMSQPNIAPDEWNRYREAMASSTGSGWVFLARRYAGFLPLVGQGALMTLAVSGLAMIIAVGLGLLLALARHYGAAPLRFVAGVYVEIVRGTPLLIQVLFIFYGLPAFGIRLSPFVAGVLALGLNYAAYEAENYRAGLLSVPRGQMEAAIALNMTHFQALRLVIVPQAFRTVVPVMTNDFISLLKDSSLVSVITLTELSQTYVRLSSTYYDYFGTGLMVGAAYLLLGLPFVRLARMAERRLGRGMGGMTGHH